jgi:hypothetical protein
VSSLGARVEARIRALERRGPALSSQAQVEVLMAVTARTTFLDKAAKGEWTPSEMIVELQILANLFSTKHARRSEPDTAPALRVLSKKATDEFFSKARGATSTDMVTTFIIRKLKAMAPANQDCVELDTEFDAHVSTMNKRIKDRTLQDRPTQNRTLDGRAAGNGPRRTCPKCTGNHSLYECRARNAVYADGTPNRDWVERERREVGGNRRDRREGDRRPNRDGAMPENGAPPPPANVDRPNIRR